MVKRFARHLPPKGAKRIEAVARQRLARLNKENSRLFQKWSIASRGNNEAVVTLFHAFQRSQVGKQPENIEKLKQAVKKMSPMIAEWTKFLNEYKATERSFERAGIQFKETQEQFGERIFGYEQIIEMILVAKKMIASIEN